MERYYLTQRPPSPGAFPGKPANMEAYDQKAYVEEIGRPAWGWVEYREPLTEKQAAEYELTRAKKPFYELDQETKTIVLELQKKCIELDLGNVSFHYYPTRERAEETEFYLTEYKEHWELVVKQRWAKTADIYRVKDRTIAYHYSEKD
jgi:hypothetical protein